MTATILEFPKRSPPPAPRADEMRVQLEKNLQEIREHAADPPTSTGGPVPMRRQLDDAIRWTCCAGWLFDHDSSRGQIYNRLRVHFRVSTLSDIPEDRLAEAIGIVESLRRPMMDFLTMVCAMKTAFEFQVMGDGEPWTPWLRRQAKGDVGSRPDWRAIADEIRSRVKVPEVKDLAPTAELG